MFHQQREFNYLALLPSGLVLFSKEKKPPDEPTSYWLMCMLHKSGKILERIINQRFEKSFEQLLANNQERHLGYDKLHWRLGMPLTSSTDNTLCEILKRRMYQGICVGCSEIFRGEVSEIRHDKRSKESKENNRRNTPGFGTCPSVVKRHV
ncbi:hypothetical protein J6590_063327 [Homalodisca vitripennis]|nr:hypothetical protein J6590_063327 [Homalodisca vitripennis]